MWGCVFLSRVVLIYFALLHDFALYLSVLCIVIFLRMYVFYWFSSIFLSFSSAIFQAVLSLCWVLRLHGAKHWTVRLKA